MTASHCKFDADLIPAILRKRQRMLDAHMLKQMRLPKALHTARLKDLPKHMGPVAEDILRNLNTIVGPSARILVFNGGIAGHQTLLSAGFMRVAHSFGFLTLWTNISEIKYYDSPTVDEERTLIDVAQEADLLVIDVPSPMDLVGRRSNAPDMRRLLRKRILDNLSTVLCISGPLANVSESDRRELNDVLQHSAQRVLFVNTDSGTITLGSRYDW